MAARVRGLAWLALSALSAWGAVGTAAAGADRELLQRILTESGVEQALATPGWWAWIRYLVGRATAGLFDLLGSGVGALFALEDLWSAVGVVLIGAAVVALMVWLTRVAMTTWRRRAGRRPEHAAVEGAIVEGTEERGAEAWRRELEALLAAGRVAAALEALWWWLAGRLAPEGADPTWTSRELVLRVGRRELLPLARTLDALAFGPRTPGVAQVRAFMARAEEALA